MTLLKSVKTVVLLATLSGLLLFGGQYFGGQQGLTMALVLSLLMNAGTYWFSDRLALSMARARPASESEHPWYFQMVRELALKAGEPMPRLYVSPSDQPNAFATGRGPKHAAVCVNEGLIAMLDPDEMEAVLAHELSHVYNRDILISSVAATIATAITFLARFAMFFGGGRDREGGVLGSFLMIFLAPIAAMLIQFAVTRSRETQADTSGALLSGKPLALASALRKLEQGGHNQVLWRRGRSTPAETSPALQSLYISAPFGGAAAMSNLFRTHPKTEVRVANLVEIARKMGQVA